MSHAQSTLQCLAAAVLLIAAIWALPAHAQSRASGATPTTQEASDAWYYKHTGGVPPR